VYPRQLTLFVDGYFTSAWDATCFTALTEKQLEFTTARALLRDGQGPPAAQDLMERNAERPSIRAYIEHARPPNPPPRVRLGWTS